MSSLNRFAVIMAGGSGERFWPLSRAHRPKQLLHLIDPNETMLQLAVSRIEPLVGADHVYVAASTSLRDIIATGDSRLLPANVIAEPCRRNTAGALIWAAATLKARAAEGVDPTMAVLTADHSIEPAEDFRRTIATALQTAEDSDVLVTIGVQPTRADTGYGYIEAESLEQGAVGVVKQFREKPDPKTAEEFLKAGNFFWNSGMFFWRVSIFFESLRKASSEMADNAEEIASALKKGEQAEAVAAFEKLESISIDYALMEKADNVRVVRAEFNWDDVGCWDSVERTHALDEQGNVAIGEPVLVDAKNNIILSDEQCPPSSVALIGVEDLVVVTTPDGFLVCAKDRVQDVRAVVKELKSRGAKNI